MEAAQIFHRCLLRVALQSSRCPNASIKPQTILTSHKHLRSKRLDYCPAVRIPIRSLSSSCTRRQDAPATSQPSAPAEKAAPTPVSPVEARRFLESYIESTQKVIDAQNLKNNLTSQEYESLVIAVTKAEVGLGAPNLDQDSFDPMLQTLKGQVEPIMEKKFNTKDIQELAQREPAPPPPPKSQPAATSSPKPSITQTMDSLFGKAPVRRQRQEPAPTMSQTQINYSALDDIMAGLGADRSSLTTPSSDLNAQRAKSLSLQYQLDAASRIFDLDNAKMRPVLRLKPTLGRTVDITPNFDLTRAFRQLESSCTKNGVKNDDRKQRTHIRRGQKKKLVRSQRWRKLFKEGFVAECDRIRRMWKQGW